MTGNPFPDGYDGPLSALRNHVEDVAVFTAIWVNRKEPDAHARRAGSAAIDAVDAMLRELHAIRQLLISEVQQADRATAARVDALLADRDRPLSGAIRPEETEGRALERPARKEGKADEHLP